MVDKIYTKDHFENVRIFHDIEKKKKFSTYSLELNRVFGDKSYDTFYKNLIEHKRARGENFIALFQRPKNMNDIKKFEEPFNIATFEEALKNMKLKTDKLNYKIKNPYTSRPPNLSITKTKTQKLLKNLKNKKLGKKMKNLKKKNIYLPEVPDVGRYNPSYDVLRKHTYQVSFSTSNFSDYNKNGRSLGERNIFKNLNSTDYSYNVNNFIKNKPINIKSINEMSKTVQQDINSQRSKLFRKKNLYLSTSQLFNTKTLNKEDPNNNSGEMNNSQIIIRNNGDAHSRCHKHLNNLYNTNSSFSLDDSKLNNSAGSNRTKSNSKSKNKSNTDNKNLKNNHCLKFDNYSKRKPLINKLNYSSEHFTNPKAFNLNYPARNQNVCLDFNKLSTSKSKQKCFVDIEASRNKNPPLGLYYPKYDLTSTKTTNVYLDKKATPLTNDRRLKKILFSYQVPSNYLLFQSLNNNNNNKKY